MKFSVTSYNAVAVWKWDTHPSSSDQHKLYHYAKSTSAGDGNGYGYGDDEDEDDDDEEDDVCGICRLAFESTCPECKIPGDDCPLSKSVRWSLSMLM
jgi:anaphase-promoting complex subunit 11